MEEEPGRKFIGPLDLALGQSTEMQQSTSVSISMIQPEPAYNPGELVRTIKQHLITGASWDPRKVELLSNRKRVKVLSSNFFWRHPLDLEMLLMVHVWAIQVLVELVPLSFYHMNKAA